MTVEYTESAALKQKKNGNRLNTKQENATLKLDWVRNEKTKRLREVWRGNR